MDSYLIIGLILAVAFFGKAKTVAIAAGILLGAKITGINKFVFPFIREQGLTVGLVFLSAAILLPFAESTAALGQVRRAIFSPVGLVAMGLSFLVTYLSGSGLRFLMSEGNADIMPALIVGSVVAAAFFGGVPVGPLVTSGMVYFALKFVGLFAG